jgi:hypothetical protein
VDDFVRSFLEGWVSRVKHPLIASFILSHIAINWQDYALLIWATPKFEERMELFRATNDHYQLVWQPLVLGLLLTMILPATSFAISKVNNWATAEHKMLIEKQAHNLRSQRAKFEDERESEREKRAKQREEEIGKLARARNELEKEVGSDAVKHAENVLGMSDQDFLELQQLGQPEVEALNLLAVEGEITLASFDISNSTLNRLGHGDRHRAKIEIIEALVTLEKKGIAITAKNSVGHKVATLTGKGYRLNDAIQSGNLKFY